MSENLKGLFNGSNEDAATSGARSLAGTAHLTNLAMDISNVVLKTAEADFENYRELIAASKVDHNAMDQLISTAFDLSTVDISFLKELDEDVLIGMMKSQQSKRSRSKSKLMTMDNYRTMMVGAIGEQLIRMTLGKEKGRTSRRASGSIDFTVEELAEIGADQERVRREIRNIQSKKSIYKAKDTFSEDDEQWQRLLIAEEQLKAMRTAPVKDDTKSKLNELLGSYDLNSLKAADAKELLKQVAALTGVVAVEE